MKPLDFTSAISDNPLSPRGFPQATLTLCRWQKAGSEALSVGKKRRGEVSVSRVGQENNNCLSCVFGTLCKLDSRKCRSTGGNTHKNAFASADFLSCGKCILVVNGNNFVINLCV